MYIFISRYLTSRLHEYYVGLQDGVYVVEIHESIDAAIVTSAVILHQTAPKIGYSILEDDVNTVTQNSTES